MSQNLSSAAVVIGALRVKGEVDYPTYSVFPTNPSEKVALEGLAALPRDATGLSVVCDCGIS